MGGTYIAQILLQLNDFITALCDNAFTLPSRSPYATCMAYTSPDKGSNDLFLRWQTAASLRKHAKCHLQKDSQFNIQGAGKGGRRPISNPELCGYEAVVNGTSCEPGHDFRGNINCPALSGTNWNLATDGSESSCETWLSIVATTKVSKTNNMSITTSKKAPSEVCSNTSKALQEV
ncbi:hypothetical protein V493_06891 [Pseudogymnoascus sp. VKM F-4281 (FW-2241)]|nr:hypothetical protein V493_06891 [Pseudogymnoascus sp. VKM F-4281 (FW-2241)]